MYLRFLNNNDYLSIMTEKVFDQTVRDRADELCTDAEKSAESTMRDYLSEHYEIDEELNVGKLIAGYSPVINITYPPEQHIYINGVIYKTLTSIMGTKKPLNCQYWKEIALDEIPSYAEPVTYSQMETYAINNIVKRLDRYYICIQPNGIDLMDIRIPDVEGWEVVDVYEWMFNDYSLNDVVVYQDIYYKLVDLTDIDNKISPDKQLKNWEVIEMYDEENTYRINDCAIYYGTSHKPQIVRAILNVNKDNIIVGTNVIEDDPRNLALRDCMLKLATYNLSKGQISPNNISSVRIKDFEDAMTWLNRAGKLQITPAIKRKKKENGNGTSEWATSQLIKEDYPFGGWSRF